MKQNPIGMELRSLNNLIARTFESSGHKKQIESITGRNSWIIGFLADNPDKDIYQKDLEEHFTITRSTVSKVLNLMEKKGFIERHSVQRDSRLKKLALTEKAWEISALMKEDRIKMERTLTDGFTKEELDSFYANLQRMKNNLKSGIH